MYKLFMVVFFSMLFTSVVFATEEYAPTRAEIMMLPEFCTHKMKETRTDVGNRKWKSIFGDVWLHMHHYCFGLNFKNRSIKKKPNSNEYKHDLNRAIGNYQYVLTRINKDHFYLPQIWLDMGNANQALKKYDEAIKNYQKSLELKKDFIPASIKLSRLYSKLGNNEESVKVIEEALKYNPNSKNLKKKLKKYKAKTSKESK